MERETPGTTGAAGVETPSVRHELTTSPTAGNGFDSLTGVPVIPTAVPAAPRRRPRVGLQFVPTVFYGSIWLVAALFIGLVILALNFNADLGAPADPLNKNLFIPRPEWYFLFLFQILKIFQGPFELIGTVVIPGIVTVVLIALPFYDRNWHKRPARRPWAISLVTAFMAVLFWLTWQSQGAPLPFTGTPSAPPVAGGGTGGTSGQLTWSANIYPIFQQSCAQCHFSGGSAVTILNLEQYASLFTSGHPGGPVQGPVVVKGDHTRSYLWQVLKGVNLQGGAQMPLGGNPLPQSEIDTIAQWIDAGAKK
jgi:hypothetical protein